MLASGTVKQVCSGVRHEWKVPPLTGFLVDDRMVIDVIDAWVQASYDGRESNITTPSGRLARRTHILSEATSDSRLEVPRDMFDAAKCVNFLHVWCYQS